MKTTLKALIISTLAYLHISTLIYAQQDITFQIKTRYPSENAVILNKVENMIIKIQDDNIKIICDHYKEKLFLTNTGHLYADEDIYSSNFTDISDINARVLVPRGKKYKKIKVDNITTKSQLSSSIFYDDNEVKHITYPKIQPGSKSTISYKEHIKDPHFLGAFYFSDYIPVINTTYSIRFPKQVKIKYTLLNDAGENISFTQSEDKKTITYKWEAKNIKKYEYESGS